EQAAQGERLVADGLGVEPQARGVALSRRFDPVRDRGLDHHRIDGVPVLPGVLGVELMAQAAGYVLGQRIERLRDVRFSSPVKLFRDQPVEVRIEAVPDADGVALTLVSFFAGPGGRQVRREHFTARAPRQQAGQAVLGKALDALEMARDPKISREEVYRRYFHGPAFQVLERVVSLGENGADARPATERPEWVAGLGHSGFITQPFLREAAFQAAGLWEMAELGRMALPAGIEELHLGAPVAPNAKVTVEARRRDSEPGGATFDVWVRDAEGRVVDFMHGYKTITLRDLAPDERFEPARRYMPAPSTLILPLDEVQRLLAEDEVATLARYLSPSEQARFAALKLDKRRLEWLAARIAAKRLIREAWFGREGAIVPYTAITIHRDSLGAPEVEIVGDKSPAPRISMSHSAGVAAAFLSPHVAVRPGIDVERIEARDASFEQTYFTEAEQAQARAASRREEALTEIWAVKEAMLKALGLGARVDFREVEALGGPEGWRVTLRGDAEKRAASLGVAEAQVEVETQGDRVIARVLLPADGVTIPFNQFSTSSEVRA
ncbi:MAG TPA: 4'-phosphopantetheinyl transferase superfamily protein, partial [Myxococcota bacterium]|nr:4'-phosphopantetheinyl transferase superfamily protein [Myxococcota bacterium]